MADLDETELKKLTVGTPHSLSIATESMQLPARARALCYPCGDSPAFVATHMLLQCGIQRKSWPPATHALTHLSDCCVLLMLTLVLLPPLLTGVGGVVCCVQVAQLKDLLKEKDLPLTGKKAELIERLLEAPGAGGSDAVEVSRHRHTHPKSLPASHTITHIPVRTPA
jgi:hypothetical protein